MRRPARSPSADAESTVNALLCEYEAARVKGWRYAVQHPRRATRMLTASRGVPVLRVVPGTDVESLAVHRELTRGRTRPLTPLHGLSAALTVPDDLASFSAGSSMQTLRRKVRAAERRGITWSPVEAEDERRLLIAVADAHELAQERDCCDPANDDLLDYDLWLVARDAAGDPLLLAVTPISGDVAALRFFRTLASSEDATLARYLMTLRLVEQLHARGVRRLVDTTISLHLSAGLRHFQRMVGFRLVRLQVARPVPAVAAPSRTVEPTRQLVGR